jgi:hypothetical protein
MNNQGRTNRPTHNVFVVEGEGDKAFWTKIGVAWQHDDGEGLNITLTAIPLNGRIVVRTPKGQKDTHGKAGQ